MVKGAVYKIVDPAACYLLGFVSEGDEVTITAAGEFEGNKAAYFIKGGFLYFFIEDDIKNGHVNLVRSADA